MRLATFLLLATACFAQIPGPYPANKDIFKMKSFYLPTIFHAAGIAYGVEMTHAYDGRNSPCVESQLGLGPKPVRAHLYLSHLAEFGAITGFRFLLKKGKIPIVGEGMALAAGSFHFYDGSQWPLYCQ